MKPLLLAAGLVLLAAPALVQAADPASPPVAAPSADPAALAAARATLANLRLNDLVRALATAKIGDLVGEAAAPASGERLNQARASATAVLDRMLPTLDDDLADALARAATAADLGQLNGFIQGHAMQSILGGAFAQASGAGKIVTTDQDKADIKAFIKSPAGQAMEASLPALKPRVERIVKSLAPRFVEAFETDFCARIACTDADHARFKAMRTKAQS
jgi:hypothetical protein